MDIEEISKICKYIRTLSGYSVEQLRVAASDSGRPQNWAGAQCYQWTREECIAALVWQTFSEQE